MILSSTPVLQELYRELSYPLEKSVAPLKYPNLNRNAWCTRLVSGAHISTASHGSQRHPRHFHAWVMNVVTSFEMQT